MAGKDSRMKYFGGCDAGSTYTKCVIIDENGKILAAVTKRSRINPVLSAKDALDEAVSQVDGLNSAARRIIKSSVCGCLYFINLNIR